MCAHMCVISEPTLHTSQLFSVRLGQMADAEAMPGTSMPPWWLQMRLDAYFKLARVQVKPGSNKTCRGVSVPVPAISQALERNADAEAMHGACRSPWWLKITHGACLRPAIAQDNLRRRGSTTEFLLRSCCPTPTGPPLLELSSPIICCRSDTALQPCTLCGVASLPIITGHVLSYRCRTAALHSVRGCIPAHHHRSCAVIPVRHCSPALCAGLHPCPSSPVMCCRTGATQQPCTLCGVASLPLITEGFLWGRGPVARGSCGGRVATVQHPLPRAAAPRLNFAA